MAFNYAYEHFTLKFNYDSDLPQLTARIQSSVIYEGRVPEGSPRPQGKTLHRQGLGPWDQGPGGASAAGGGAVAPRASAQLVPAGSAGRLAGWPAQERGAGSWHAPAIRMESWPEPERTSGVYKNVPPRGASASRDSERLSFFSLFATPKNKPFVLFRNAIRVKTSYRE